MPVVHPSVRWVLLVLALALALVAGLYLGRQLACRDDGCAGPPGTGAQGLDVDGTAAVTIAGSSVRPMWPGARVPLNLTLTNTQDFAMTADHLAVTIERVRAPRASARRGCTARDFAVVQAATTVAVELGAGQTTTLRSQRVPSDDWPQIAMVDSATNQDGCKGASLSLRYAATGIRADR